MKIIKRLRSLPGDSLGVIRRTPPLVFAMAVLSLGGFIGASTVLNPLTRTVEAPIKPPRDKTAIAKTSGGVRRITPRESPGSDLSLLIIFIVYQYVCRSFLTAEPKEKY